MTQLHVRYFAGAAEAAGRESETLDVQPELTLADALRGRGERLDRVLDVATLLVARRRVDPSTPVGELGDEPRVDVLPPFAGG